MNPMPPNCPLTPERWARIHPSLQTSKTAVWVWGFQNPDNETLDRVLEHCNRDALPAIARSIVHSTQHFDQVSTEALAVRERVMNGT